MGDFSIKDPSIEDGEMGFTSKGDQPSLEEMRAAQQTIVQLKQNKEVEAQRQTWLARGRMATQMVTGTALSIAGAPAGVPGVVGMGAVGTGLGGMAYDSAIELGRAVGMIPQEGTAQGTPGEVLKRGAGDAAIDLVTGGAVVKAPGAARALGRTVLGVTPESRTLRTLAEKIGVDLGSLNVSTSRLVGSIPTVMGRFPFLGGPMRRSAVRQAEQTHAAGRMLHESVGPVITLVDDLGVDMAAAARRSFATSSDYLERQWKRAYEEGGDLVVMDTRSLKAAAAEQFAQVRGPSAQIPLAGKKPLELQSSEAIDLAERLMALPEYITARQHRVVSDHLTRILDKTMNKDTVEFGRAAAMKKGTESMLETAQGPQVLVENFQRAKKAHINHSEFFATPTAKKFRQADRNIFRQGPFKAGTKTENQLFSLAFSGNNQRDLVDLRKLVGQDVFRRAARNHVDDAWAAAVKPVSKGGLTAVLSPQSATHLDVRQLRMSLGLDAVNSPRYNAFKTMLQLAGSGVTPKQFGEFLDVAENTLGQEIPNVAAMVARRGILGGLRGVMKSFTLGTGGGFLAGGGGGALAGGVSTLAIIGMFRGIGRLITSPGVLKWATNAIDVTKSQKIRRTAITRLVRMIPELREENLEEITMQDVQQLAREQ